MPAVPLNVYGVRGRGYSVLIDTGTDRRYVRRSKGGQFKESDDGSRSLSADRRTKAKTKAKRGQGDRGVVVPDEDGDEAELGHRAEGEDELEVVLAQRAVAARDVQLEAPVARPAAAVLAMLTFLATWKPVGGIIRVVHVLGDRRDHFESMKDVWEMFRVILDERKKRETDPTLQLLRELNAEAKKSGAARFARAAVLVQQRVHLLHDRHLDPGPMRQRPPREIDVRLTKRPSRTATRRERTFVQRLPLRRSTTIRASPLFKVTRSSLIRMISPTTPPIVTTSMPGRSEARSSRWRLAFW